MPAVTRRILYVKLSIIAVALFFAAFAFQKFSAKYEKVSASAYGPTASRTNAPGETNCRACHSDYALNSGTGGITISGLPANYLPNQQIPITVTTSQEDGVNYGFQMTAIDANGKRVGTYTLPPSPPLQQLQLITGSIGGNMRTYIEHTSDGIIPTVAGSKSWTFNWTTPAQRVGKVSFYAAGNAANSDGGTGGDYIYTTVKSTLSGTAISNFDADGKSDIAVFRPSTGTWYSLNSTNGNLSAATFGTNGDKVVAGDYDGDGKTDYAVFRPSNGAWYVLKSSGGFVGVVFGTNGDIPVVGDYDGDLKSDFAVYRPSNGTWYYLKSSDGTLGAIQFGVSTDKPAQGDYDGDGKTDVAVFRPSNGTWYIQRSSLGYTGTQFGANGDKPVPADYDGDGKTDIAVYRPSEGSWYRLNSANNSFSGVNFGIASDKPVPADYDGDGKADVAVYRNNSWYVLKSSDNSFYGVAFGDANDIPVPSGYIAP
ncbi:MAG: FG-GAP-like repeat-containing protein [Acidobacteriota bacterium]|nr:FG-GAP-like repeat-containing protein [Acidobacteriota bacterium]